MVTFYPDVSCWAWVMAHAALISPMWLNACGKFPIISPLAGTTSSASRPTSNFPERSVVSPARPGSPVEVLLVGHSLGGGVRVGVVEGSECLVRNDGQLEPSA